MRQKLTSRLVTFPSSLSSRFFVRLRKLPKRRLVDIIRREIRRIGYELDADKARRTAYKIRVEFINVRRFIVNSVVLFNNTVELVVRHTDMVFTEPVHGARDGCRGAIAYAGWNLFLLVLNVGEQRHIVAGRNAATLAGLFGRRRTGRVAGKTVICGLVAKIVPRRKRGSDKRGVEIHLSNIVPISTRISETVVLIIILTTDESRLPPLFD